MTRADLAIEVARQLGGSKKDAMNYIDAVFEGIKIGLERDDRVAINSFGVFYTLTKAPYTSKNPKTGQVVEVPERRHPKIRYSSSVKERLNPKG